MTRNGLPESEEDTPRLLGHGFPVSLFQYITAGIGQISLTATGSVGDATTRDEASMQDTDPAQAANISLPPAEAPASEAPDQASPAGSTGDPEPDPREDIYGDDMQHKLVLIARAAGLDINLAGVPVENFVAKPLRNWKPPAGAEFNSRE